VVTPRNQLPDPKERHDALALPPIMIEPLVRMALLEDLGPAGDLTTDAIVPLGHRATTLLVARQTGVVAGLDLAQLAFQLIDPAIEMRRERNDGVALAPGDVIAIITGPARGILTAERVALNFLCRLGSRRIGRRSGSHRSLWPHHARHSATNCRDRRRPDLDRLAHP
jgi:hypothetical protein